LEVRFVRYISLTSGCYLRPKSSRSARPRLCKGRIVQVPLVDFSPEFHCGLSRVRGPLTHFIHDIFHPEGEGVAMVEITGFLESPSPLKAVDSIRRTGDVCHVVVTIILDAAGSLRLAQQLQAIIADDHVDDAPLPLIYCSRSLYALEGGN
jgi:hypothetical protein